MAADDVQKLAKNQQALQDNLVYLKKKVGSLEKRVAYLEGDDYEEPEETAVETPGTTAMASAKKVFKETSKPIENLGFKVFGTIGFLFILLGLFYLYRFAVDQGWIGILGRVVLGVIFSMAIILTSFVFDKKGYAKYSQLLAGGGIALLYFTFYATYHFPAYREALGMTLGLNTVLLLLVMAFGVLLAMKQDSMILTSFAFLLGYLASLLAGGVHERMITAIILSIGMAVILWKKNWRMAIYPAVASYLIYFIYFADKVLFSRDMSPDVLAGIAYLAIFFVLFNLLAILLKDDERNTQNVMIALVSAAMTLGFGLMIVWRHWHTGRGVFVIMLAAAYLYLAFIAKKRDLSNLFQGFFIICIVMLTVAVPVQLEKAWVTLAWAVEGLMLLQIGVNRETKGLRILGYLVLLIATIRVLLYDSWALGFGERTLAFLAVTLGLYGASYLISTLKADDRENVIGGILVLAGTVVLTVALAVEILDPKGMLSGLSGNVRQVALTVVWALEAVTMIVLGFMGRSKLVRMLGIILFGITMIKVLTVDLGNLETIWRTVVTILVGIIALGASFAYVKNKDKLQELLKDE
ncbi:DUF2339 domain-containing protein [Candidatus Woesearchaeota archaeon]|nr:DUF2339 domain-containing protein [Candidatus Woesearchaeota archaeon]